MARVKHSRTKRLVLDIGSSAIRLCELSRTKTGYQLTKYMQREMLVDPSMDEDARGEVLRETLRAMLKESKIRARKVVMGVPGQSVFTRNRALPPVPEYKLTQIVRYEIQQQIPFALDQIALDYQVLQRTEAGGYEVMMAAIKVDVVEKHIEPLRDVKRSIDTVGVCPIASYNWLKHVGEFAKEGECVALVDLGAVTTDIVIERESQFRFTRSINVGGNDITRAIGEAFGLNFSEAEKQKRERGFAPTGDPERDGKGGEVIGRVLQRLVSEVNRSFGYFRSQPGGGPVSRVILCGGGACLRNIVPYLQRQLGVDVRVCQPLAGLAIAPAAQEVNDNPEQACVVLGLSLRCLDTVPIEVNLIPPRVLLAARHKEQALYWALVLAVLGMICASIIPVAANENKNVRQEIEVLKSKMQLYDPNLASNPNARSVYETRLDNVTGIVNSYKSDVQNLDTGVSMITNWLRFVKAIHDARPPTGTIAFSSIETAIIGGPGNTAGGEAAAQAAEQASTSFSGGFGGLMDMPPGMDDPMAGMMDMMSMFGGSGPGAGPISVGTGPKTFDIQGFQGVDPVLGGGTEDDPKSLPPTPPNGLTVRGYADSPETVTDFVDALKQSGVFKEGGVYFDESTVNKVGISTLANAPVDRSSASSMGGMAGMMGGMGGMGGMMDMGGMMGGMMGGGGRSRERPTEPQVTEFSVTVQFYGDVIEPESS